MSKLQQKIAAGESFYVSITGLRLRRPWHIFVFMRYAIPSFRASQLAEGNLYSAVTTVTGTRHTLSAWESKKAMQDYAYRGVHLKAIKVFKKFFTGKIYGYETKVMPSWDEARSILAEKGRDY